MTAVWRLLMHGPVDGALNMAIDRAVQLAREQHSAPPTLRLYRWSRPTVTLGRFQDASSVDLDVCEAEGIDAVRRFTGGRGVLHDHELTYSIVAGLDDGVPRGVAASYRHLCGGIVAAYRALGVDASLTTLDRGAPHASACYLHTTRADVSVGSRKLSGSAQVWCGSTVLQHGSFILGRDAEREARVFRLDTHHADKLLDASRSLEELLSSPVDFDAVADAVTSGFAQALGLELIPGELSACEAEMAAELLHDTRLNESDASGISTGV